ncbi:MAG: D-alanyl-D-alanine carboxypeptidase/D-alanyl-D-alanine-endopeptidase [Deinococcales bacterium]|nr:D-alanyl-D-alanine carboxypeptidase/D-alanyl-D-alanine-endopeptidase [Chitinophagaceae bacterium]
MKQLYLTIGLIFFVSLLAAQTVGEKLATAIKNMQADTAFKHASMSLYVVETNSNKVVFDYNSQLGLAPASCQKIITSVTAFELLGNNYKYKTELSYDGTINNGVLKGNLYIVGSGDPTLGSWRYLTTNDSLVLANWLMAIKKVGIKNIKGNVFFDGTKLAYQPLPGGWIWDDIGNYYGAGSWGLNWHENQYDLVLQPGNNEGDDVYILETKPALQKAYLKPLLTTGKKGSGDNGYIYLPPNSTTGFVTGTVPAGEKLFTIAGAMPNPTWQIEKALEDKLLPEKIGFKNMIDVSMPDNTKAIAKPILLLQTHLSPSLDSINYWFLKKSINLYGEALLKTIAYEKTGIGSTEKGIDIVKKFWLEKGISKGAIYIIDGSGLSPQNRITTDVLVKVLQYAKDKTWFNSFYKALPLYNNMTLKSGTIGGTKSFAGYHTSKAGVNYTVAFIVNNFDGAASNVVKKMFTVLDQLK